jgi:hypothetical protein
MAPLLFTTTMPIEALSKSAADCGEEYMVVNITHIKKLAYYFCAKVLRKELPNKGIMMLHEHHENNKLLIRILSCQY